MIAALMWRGGRSMALITAAAVVWSLEASAHKVVQGDGRQPTIGPATEFRLTSHEGVKWSLSDVRGKVVVVNFIYTRCADVCPLLTRQLVEAQNTLGGEFGSRVHFVSITVDPGNDRPETLAQYAKALGCDLDGWTFLTGTYSSIQAVAKDYGVYIEPRERGDVDHNLLTSIVDQAGSLRVQYMGHRFKLGEFLRDLREVIAEGTS